MGGVSVRDVDVSVLENLMAPVRLVVGWYAWLWMMDGFVLEEGKTTKGIGYTEDSGTH
jgi:hypothetical protein